MEDISRKIDLSEYKFGPELINQFEICSKEGHIPGKISGIVNQEGFKTQHCARCQLPYNQIGLNEEETKQIDIEHNYIQLS